MLRDASRRWSAERLNFSPWVSTEARDKKSKFLGTELPRAAKRGYDIEKVHEVVFRAVQGVIVGRASHNGGCRGQLEGQRVDGICEKSGVPNRQGREPPVGGVGEVSRMIEVPSDETL